MGFFEKNGKDSPELSRNISEGTKNKTEGKISQHVIHSVLAHDLKGFMGNLIVMLDIVLKDGEIEDMEEHLDMLSKLKSSAASMNTLLDNFLFWVKIENCDFDLRPLRVNITRMLNENIELISGFASNKNIVLKFESSCDCYASGDEYLLNTVVRNLLYNALKFTGDGGEIKVSAMDLNDFVTVSVEDNGIGMEQWELEMLFDAKKVYTTTGTRNEPGSGLGLILSREFIEKNGGSLKVESAKHKGSVFSFTIPVHKN